MHSRGSVVPERWRERLWISVPRRGVGLDVGGRGNNASRYPSRSRVVACDVSIERVRASRRAGSTETLCVVADPDALPFDAGTFDWATTSLTLCRRRRVDAAATELARVVRPGGACYLLEPVRPQGWRGRLADLLSLVAGALCRVYVNHDVARTLDAAGLHIERRTRVWSDVVVVLVGRSRRRDEPLPPDTCGDAARRALPRATSVAASAPAATVGPSLLFPE